MLKKITAIYVKLSRREKFMFFGALGAMMVLFTQYFVLQPALEKVLAISSKIGVQEVTIKKSFQILLRKEQIQKEGKQFEGFSVEGRSQEEEMTSLLKDIESLADRSSVTLMFVRPGTIKEEVGVVKYTASLECEAEMPSVANFFHSIENSKKLLQVDKYDIQPKSKDSTVTRCAMTVSKTVLAG